MLFLPMIEIDSNSLVRPQYEWKDSGNGMFYSAVAIALGFEPSPEVLIAMKGLWQPGKGVLYRTPDNQYGQESHDNYTALAYLTLYARQKRLARSIIWSAVKKVGFMQNNNEKGSFIKSQMFRFPQIWAVLFYVAFPNIVTKKFAELTLRLVIRLSKPDLGNASGVQLKWFICHLHRMVTNDSKEMRKFLLEVREKNPGGIGEVMRPYYAPGHTIVEGYREYEKRLIGSIDKSN